MAHGREIYWNLYSDSSTQTPSLHLPKQSKYADDLALAAQCDAEDKNGNLQQAINKTMEWCTAHNMIANPKDLATRCIITCRCLFANRGGFHQ